MGKNIVLCADGTGNKGGYTPDSNVYKMYHAVDIHDDNNRQVIYYDNGVGTASNKFLRALGGAVGFGFGTNVKDLYKFLARKYEPGDKVYLFGFSRGAATIRAFSGFIHACGLVDASKLTVSNDELTEKVDAEFEKYRKLKGADPSTRPDKIPGESHGVIDIQFLGVWDTVSALGFPERTDITSIGMWVLNWAFKILGNLIDIVPGLAHRFYNYKLTDNVQFAHQALALDDARTAFWPWVWDEHGRTTENVEQVWFAGMHSNVGGGYQRSGMAKVTLSWMMKRAMHRGLVLRQDKVAEARAEAHVHGRMYDSRDGFAMFYRFHPRELLKLSRQNESCCRKGLYDESRPFAVSENELKNNSKLKASSNKLLGEIKVHDSVIRRMRLRTANYAPTQLPDKFDVVKAEVNVPTATVNLETNAKWATAKNIAWWLIFFRKWLYGLMLEATIAVVGIALYFWVTLSESVSCEWDKEFEGTFAEAWVYFIGHPAQAWVFFNGHLAEVLDYFLPDIFCGLITLTLVEDKGKIFWTAIAVIVVYMIVRTIARHQTVNLAERLRRLVVRAEQPVNP